MTTPGQDSSVHDSTENPSLTYAEAARQALSYPSTEEAQAIPADTPASAPQTESDDTSDYPEEFSGLD